MFVIILSVVYTQKREKKCEINFRIVKDEVILLFQSPFNISGRYHSKLEEMLFLCCSKCSELILLKGCSELQLKIKKTEENFDFASTVCSTGPVAVSGALTS